MEIQNEITTTHRLGCIGRRDGALDCGGVCEGELQLRQHQRVWVRAMPMRRLRGLL